MSAAANVGSSWAKICPLWTTSPTETSMERTIAVSNGCTTSVEDRATTTPVAVTTRSTLMTEARTANPIIMLLMIRVRLRAIRGIGMLMIAVDGDWYSRMAGRVGSSRSAVARLIAPEEGRGKSCMT